MILENIKCTRYADKLKHMSCNQMWIDIEAVLSILRTTHRIIASVTRVKYSLFQIVRSEIVLAIFKDTALWQLFPDFLYFEIPGGSIQPSLSFLLRFHYFSWSCEIIQEKKHTEKWHSQFYNRRNKCFRFSEITYWFINCNKNP